MKQVNSLSFFFPFWNEEDNIESVVKKAMPVIANVAKQWEIILVDDGSSDATLKLAETLAKENKSLRVISHTPNRGYGASLKDGFFHAKYDIIGFADGDNQFDITEIVHLLEKIDKADIVIGYRNKRHDHPFRHILMNLLKVWDFVLFGFSFRDIDCGFKLFKKNALKKIMPLRSEGAMVTTEILAKAKKKHLKIVEVAVSHYPRKYGNQSGGNLRFIIRAIRESLTLLVDLHYGRA